MFHSQQWFIPSIPWLVALSLVQSLPELPLTQVACFSHIHPFLQRQYQWNPSLMSMQKKNWNPNLSLTLHTKNPVWLVFFDRAFNMSLIVWFSRLLCFILSLIQMRINAQPALNILLEREEDGFHGDADGRLRYGPVRLDWSDHCPHPCGGSLPSSEAA